MQLEAMIEQDRTSNWRRSNDGAPCASDSILQLVNSQPWECDKVTKPLSSHGELADGDRLNREARRKLKLHSEVNS